MEKLTPTEVAGEAVEALRKQPLALAVILINILFIFAGIWVLHEIGDYANQTRQALLKLMECRP